MADIYCARCGEVAWFAAGCEGVCGRVLCEDCAAPEGYCPECYIDEPVPSLPVLVARVKELEAEVDRWKLLATDRGKRGPVDE